MQIIYSNLVFQSLFVIDSQDLKVDPGLGFLPSPASPIIIIHIMGNRPEILKFNKDVKKKIREFSKGQTSTSQNYVMKDLLTTALYQL